MDSREKSVVKWNEVVEVEVVEGEEVVVGRRSEVRSRVPLRASAIFNKHSTHSLRNSHLLTLDLRFSACFHGKAHLFKLIYEGSWPWNIILSQVELSEDYL